jgi:nucleotide-binding universal stress UspA family protein
LRVLASDPEPVAHGRHGAVDDWLWQARDECERTIRQEVAVARAIRPGLSVTGTVKLGDPAAQLIAASRDADLLVVGSRGLGGYGGLLCGSVSRRVATHAAAPVVVVRGRVAPFGPVVVGVDDSPNMEHVVEAGFKQAGRSGVSLIAVHAYGVPVPPVGAGEPVRYDVAVAHAAAASRLTGIIDRWRDKYPTVEVQTVAGRGGAAQVLTRVSATAGLVVVGGRADGAITGSLLGPVGLHLLHHAECSVLIVCPTRRPPERCSEHGSHLNRSPDQHGQVYQQGYHRAQAGEHEQDPRHQRPVERRTVEVEREHLPQADECGESDACGGQFAERFDPRPIAGQVDQIHECGRGERHIDEHQHASKVVGEERRCRPARPGVDEVAEHDVDGDSDGISDAPGTGGRAARG